MRAFAARLHWYLTAIAGAALACRESATAGNASSTVAERAPAHALAAQEPMAFVDVTVVPMDADADPLADIANTRRIAGVLAQGRWYSAYDLHARLELLANVYARQP